MTTLKDIVDLHQWKDIYRRMAKLYPKPHKNLEGYKRVFKVLRKLDATKKRSRLLIELYACYDKYDDRYYTSVHGVTPKRRGDTYALEFSSWQEWLGMRVSDASIYAYESVDIICHCLYEMTFFGFTPKDVGNNVADVKTQMDANIG